VRQLLVESVLLGVAAGAIAVLLALWAVDLLLALIPETLPHTAAVAVDGRVLAFAVATSIGTGLLFGIVPALTISDARLQDALRASAPGAARSRTRAALVLVEVALAFVLLVGAGLTLRAVEALRRQPLGFDARDVLTFQLAASPTRYGTPERMRAFQRELVARLGALPGVRVASLAADLPLSDTTSEIGFKRREDPPPQPGDVKYAVYYPVTSQYHAALGIPLLAGRLLADADAAGSTPVALVDEELARRTFGGEDPLGKWISNRSNTRTFQIVGVVRHVKHFGLGAEEDTPYQLYFPLAQVPADEVVSGTRYVYPVLKTSVPPLSLADAVRAEVASIDPNQPIFDVRTMEDRVVHSLEGERFTLVLLAAFAALALLLAAMGLYAVMSYAVTRRTHEIGVRMALGAQPGAVQRMVVAEGLKLAGGGLAVGALAAVGVARVGASLVSGVRPLDGATYAAVALVLAAVATAAAWFPARRATRVDPTVALREE
jgi:putative ABC transport system permease protein